MAVSMISQGRDLGARVLRDASPTAETRIVLPAFSDARRGGERAAVSYSGAAVPAQSNEARRVGGKPLSRQGRCGEEEEEKGQERVTGPSGDQL